jgi:hypothetical protein
MRSLRPIFAVILVAATTLGGAAPASARTLVDPTSLTPPLKPFRICYQLGPYVQCDTSGNVTIENELYDTLPCGELYQSESDVSNSTRWYQDGLIVRRAVQEREQGTWSLSPTGDGPTVAFNKDSSWDEHFTIPGDISSGVADIRGLTLQVPALGRELHESGLFVAEDDTLHGLFTTDEPDGVADLCALLVG